MFLVPCLRCNTAVRVIGDPVQIDLLIGDKSEYWPNKYVCVNCEQPCTAHHEMEVELDVLALMKMRELSPEEMLAAQMGLGTPDEMMCDAATVNDLLLHRRIKNVASYTVKGTTRCCLTVIELEDGVKLHFGSSAHGAVVYRISRPISYQQRVLKESAK